MAGNRIDRISSEYKQCLAEALRTVKDPRVQGLVSITRCEVTGDLRYARVFISVYGDELAGKRAMQGLRSATGYLRREVAQKIGLRAAPEPMFSLDRSISHGSEILSILNKIESAPEKAAITVHDTLEEACQRLEAADRILILTHLRPDGDTLGSASALCRILRKLDKEAYVLKNPEATEKYDFLLSDLIAPDDYVPDYVVAVDTAAASMLPEPAQKYANRVDLLLDHHEGSREYARASYCEPKTAAVGEIILKVLDYFELELDRPTAEAIYTAISTDTGCFRFSNTSAQTFETARRCALAGADMFDINLSMFMIKNRSRIGLESQVLHDVQFDADGRVASCTISAETISRLGATRDDMDDISSIVRYIEGVELAIVVTQYGEDAKVSVRSSRDYNSAALCAQFGGGGHAAAAGATLREDIESVRAKFVEAAVKMLS